MQPLEAESFPTYGALARNAMFFGVPIVPAFFIMFIFTLILIIGMPIFGLKATLIVILAVPIFMFMKQICRNDDKALEIVAYELYCYTLKKNAKAYNNTLTIFGSKYFGKNNDDICRLFKEDFKQAGFPPRLTGENIPTRHT